MDAETLKIILQLKEENVLLRRAIGDIGIMLSKKEKYLVLQYGLDEKIGTETLFKDLYEIIPLLKERKKPTS